MGIYSNGVIYGIQIYNINDDNINILFEKKYDTIISDEEMKEVYLFYIELNDKNNIHFKIYTEVSSTLDKYNKENYMMWYPISLNIFLEKFASSML